MMELFLLEHKKLWRKKSTKISVFLCFLYVVIFGSILSFQWFSFGSPDDYTSAFGNNFDGYGVIRDSQEYSLEFGGELTEENLQQMVRDYQRMESAGMETELDKTDWQSMNSWLESLVAIFTDYGSCPDWPPVHAACGKRLVKTAEGLVKSGKTALWLFNRRAVYIQALLLLLWPLQQKRHLIFQIYAVNG